jgi:predicted MFS family arabinose efflux permease
MHGRGAFIAIRNVASQIGIATTALLGGILFERFGYGGVGVLCAALTLVVILLLQLQIQEPLGDQGAIRTETLTCSEASEPPPTGS